MNFKAFFILQVVAMPVLLFSGCNKKDVSFYSLADFPGVPKIDVHFHYYTTDLRYLRFADSLNFRLMSPNVDAGVPIREQFEIASLIRKKHPGKFAFMGTFPVSGFYQNDFAEKTIAWIDTCVKEGACGIKIWKNIGMELKDSSGKYVMVTDPVLKPVFDYLENKHIPVMAHLGEPRNCWLPLEEMTLGNDKNYFRSHPQYHMYLHPEAPSYEDQINARDSLLRRHPGLVFTGAHLASLEWSVDELAERLDKYPLLTVDMAARIGHLQYQSEKDPEKVRNFLIKYQDRIMYATDSEVDGNDTVYSGKTASLLKTWTNHWIYLATDSSVVVKELNHREIKGIQLPADVIDKIYYRNAERFFSVE